MSASTTAIERANDDFGLGLRTRIERAGKEIATIERQVRDRQAGRDGARLTLAQARHLMSQLGQLAALAEGAYARADSIVCQIEMALDAKAAERPAGPEDRAHCIRCNEVLTFGTEEDPGWCCGAWPEAILCGGCCAEDMP